MDQNFCLVSENTSDESSSSEDSMDEDNDSDNDIENHDSDGGNNESIDDPLLYDNAEITLSTFSYLLLLYSIKHNLSGKAKDDLLDFFNVILPHDNLCPSSVTDLEKLTNCHKLKNNHHQLCSKCHCNLQNDLCTNNECENNNQPDKAALKFYVMDIESQLQRIVTGFQI